MSSSRCGCGTGPSHRPPRLRHGHAVGIWPPRSAPSSGQRDIVKTGGWDSLKQPGVGRRRPAGWSDVDQLVGQGNSGGSPAGTLGDLGAQTPLWRRPTPSGCGAQVDPVLGWLPVALQDRLGVGDHLEGGQRARGVDFGSAARILAQYGTNGAAAGIGKNLPQRIDKPSAPSPKTTTVAFRATLRLIGTAICSPVSEDLAVPSPTKTSCSTTSDVSRARPRTTGLEYHRSTRLLVDSDCSSSA
jgi:hypothetical protein